MANSLAGQGPFSDFHYFQIFDLASNNETKISWKWILFGSLIVAILSMSIGIAYYYKHKIVTLLTRQDDSAVLMKNVEDDIDVSSSRCDTLSDITENDEDVRN